jgi:proteasome lid subunit RPN8/RPN11
MNKYLKYIDALENEYKLFDLSETIQISSVGLMKMLRHGKAGVPIEVMGLMLGKFVDSLNLKVSDVFAMPQSGTGISVEAIDPVFQTKMLDLLSQVNFGEFVVGWYHSHPGFGCWLSGVDINTHQSFENLNKGCIAVVIDPIQSVKEKIILEAYRLHPQNYRGQQIREMLNMNKAINKKVFQKDNHGLNDSYYSLNISFRKNLLEEIVLTSIFENRLEIINSNNSKIKENPNSIRLFMIIENLKIILDKGRNSFEKENLIISIEKNNIISMYIKLSELISYKCILLCIKEFFTTIQYEC